VPHIMSFPTAKENKGSL